jgi:hypothetical protein
MGRRLDNPAGYDWHGCPRVVERSGQAGLFQHPESGLSRARGFVDPLMGWISGSMAGGGHVTAEASRSGG